MLLANLAKDMNIALASISPLSESIDDGVKVMVDNGYHLGDRGLELLGKEINNITTASTHHDTPKTLPNFQVE